MKIERNYDLLRQSFDLVVIGGGISGASIAYEAALRGLKTCLVEKNDFGGATSAATSKLIHGGIRYLANYEFGLVRESLRERRILAGAAAHLVRPQPMISPVYENGTLSKKRSRLGMLIYDLLSMDRNRGLPAEQRVPGHRWFKKEEMLKLEPWIKSEGLQGAFQYYDYQSLYPERLTLAFIKSAVNAGAFAFNHLEAAEFKTEIIGSITGTTEDVVGATRRLRSVVCRDTLTNKTYELRSRLFVNASGPWMDYLLGMVQEDHDYRLQRSQGIHLITEPIAKKRCVIYSKESSYFFIIPWGKYSLIGATDTPYNDSPNDLRARKEDIQDFIEQVNGTLPGAPLKKEMIKNVIIGLRPLIFSKTGTYQSSRKSDVYDHNADGLDGLVSVAGGKWTTSRGVAEETVKLLLKKSELHHIIKRKVDSGRLPLFGSPGFGVPATKYPRYQAPGLSQATIEHLTTLYGIETESILEIVKTEPALAATLHQAAGERTKDDIGDVEIMAQICFAIKREGALTLSDILNRRLTIGQTGYPSERVVKCVAEYAGKLLGWTVARRKREIDNYRELYRPLADIGALKLGRKRANNNGAADKKTARKVVKKSSKKPAGKTPKKVAKKAGKKTPKKVAKRR